MSFSSPAFIAWTRLSLPALACILGSTAAMADVTAQDVWSDWRSYFAGYGYSVEGTDTRDGATLTISDVVIAMDGAQIGGNGAIRAELGKLTFTETGEGTVVIGIPGSIPLNFINTAPEGEVLDVSALLTQTGFAMTASGMPGDLRYDYVADGIGARLAKMTVDGEVVPAEVTKLDVLVSQVAGTSTASTTTERRTDTQRGAAATLTYDIKFTDPAQGSTAAIAGASEDLRFDSTTVMPLSVAPGADLAQLLGQGFRFDGKFEYGMGRQILNADGPQGPFRGQSSSEAGNFNIAVAQDSVTYGVETTGVSVDLVAEGSPLPISFQMGAARFELSAPVQKNDAAQDFALGLTLDDFTMSDRIWGIFDPQGQLPRDPATIVLDLTGKARMLVDFFNSAQTAAGAASGTSLAELAELQLNRLQITALGAELTGSGAATFDAPQTPGAVPAAEGSVDLKLTGVNGLIEALSDTGLLPMQQAMAARMMLGFFTQQGAGEDTLTSRLEITKGGSIFANGQQVR